MDNDEFQTIAKAEFNHWWYKSLHELVFKNIKKNFLTKDIKIIDAGCGTGGLIYKLAREGYKNVEGFDISDTAVKLSSIKGLKVFKGDIRNIDQYYQSADVIISNDTFYFLNQDEQIKVADKIYDLLTYHGILILNVPVFKAFRGIHDRRVGIAERFTSKNIINIFDKNKFEVITRTYWPFLLSPLILMIRSIQRLKLKLNKNIKIKSDVENNFNIFNSVFYFITKFENSFLTRKPFGSSLFIVMKKK